jgi:hypothetical protein
MNKKQKIAKRKQKKSRLRLKAKQADLLKNKKVITPKAKVVVKKSESKETIAKKPAAKKPAAKKPAAKKTDKDS